MIRVARSGNRANFKRRDADNIPVIHDRDPLFGDGVKTPPEPLHLITINPRGGVDQLIWINEMWGSTRMDVNCGPEFGKTPGGPRVIKVDVTQENVSHIFDGAAGLSEFVGEIGKGRFGASIEQEKTILSLD